MTDSSWDFLSPWCKELKGRLLLVDEGKSVRVLTDRVKSPSEYTYPFVDEEWEALSKQDKKQRLVASQWRIREAIELLALVEKIDQRAWVQLLTKECGLKLDDAESDEEDDDDDEELNEEDFMEDDEDEESGDEDEEQLEVEFGSDHEEEEDDDDEDGEGRDNEGDNDSDAGGEESGDDNDDGIAEVIQQVFNAEHRKKPDPVIPLRFDFISLQTTSMPDTFLIPPIQEWRRLFLSKAAPSTEYEEAKARLLEMRAKDPNCQMEKQTSLEIPISLELGHFTKDGDCLVDLKEFITKHNNFCSDQDDAFTFVYRLESVSLGLTCAKISDSFTNNLLGVLGTGIHLSELNLSLKNQPDVVKNRQVLAKLLTGVLIRPPDSELHREHSISKLEVQCDDIAPWQCQALCSAFSASRILIEQVQISNTRHCNWKSLAQTFFHPQLSRGPFSSIRGLKIEDTKLTVEDVADVAAVLQEKQHQLAISRQWDLCRKQWKLIKGSQLHFAGGEPLKLPFDTRVELVESNEGELLDSIESDWIHVIVLAYGPCRVARNAVRVDEAEQDQLNILDEPLRSLSLACKWHAEGVSGLLEHVGWSLRSLSLSFHREIDVDAMIPAIFRGCPQLTTLKLCDSNIDLNRFATAYERLDAPKLTTLDFYDLYGIGRGKGKAFANKLGDPTSRLAKHLRKLSIYTDENAKPLQLATLSRLWRALQTNTTLAELELMGWNEMLGEFWKKRFHQLNGQAIAPYPLPVPCKLAFLSVTRRDEGRSAAQRLDQRVLSLVFEFADEPAVRLVKVYC